MSVQTVTPGLFTKTLAAQYLSVSIREVDNLRAQGHLIAVGKGKQVFFRRADLDRYIEQLPERGL